MRRILCLVVILLPCSCTVKENRSDCPCDLLVLPAEKLESEGSVVVSLVQDGAVVGQEMLGREDFEAGKCLMTVNRRPTTVTVFSGITSMSLQGGRKLSIRSAQQCDELFTSTSDAKPSGDSFECQVCLHKNFARLFLTVLNLRNGMDMRITGTVSGYDILDTEPCEGDFNIPAERGDAARGCCIRLPRQTDESLALEVSVRGVTVKTVPLGSIIAATGYSFKDEDLMDIVMTVDLEKSYASVTVGDWDSITIPLIVY